MKHVKIGLLNKKRGNFTMQEKFTGAGEVTDRTLDEVGHHEEALRRGGRGKGMRARLTRE